MTTRAALAGLAIAVLAGCSVAYRDRNADQLRALAQAADCDARLPFFGYYRYAGQLLPQYEEPDGSITLRNDGGWCVIVYQVLTISGSLATTDASLLTPPTHGTVVIGTLDGLLRIAYRPEPGYAGTDGFSVHLDGPIPYDVPVRVRISR